MLLYCPWGFLMSTSLLGRKDLGVIDTTVVQGLTSRDNRLSRYSGLLHFIARQVLGGSEGVEEAIENCRLTASQNARQFESEGAFRSWLFRILIDEATAVRRSLRK